MEAKTGRSRLADTVLRKQTRLIRAFVAIYIDNYRE